MRLVLDVASALALTSDLDLLLHRIADAATKLAGAERASIFLHDPQTNQLWTKVALGASEIRVPATAGIVGHVFQSNQTLLVPEAYDDPRFNREIDRKNNFHTRNLLTVPVKDVQRKQIGVLQVVNRIGGPFSGQDQVLTELLADQAGVALQRHYLQRDLQAEAVRLASYQREMELAKRVQGAMIPPAAPHLDGIVAAGWVKPADITGGDTYDLWTLADGRMGIFLGDASGHGLAPALIVSQARTLIRSLCEIDCDPGWVLTRVNGRLSHDLEMGRFVTAFMGCISGDGLLHWCSAGHAPMFLIRSPDSPVELLDALAAPVGVMAELNADPTPAIQLAPGGTFVVMSDGVFEARAPDSQLFEVERVSELLDKHRHGTPEEIIARFREAILQWQGCDAPADDQTIVVLKRT